MSAGNFKNMAVVSKIAAPFNRWVCPKNSIKVNHGANKFSNKYDEFKT